MFSGHNAALVSLSEEYSSAAPLGLDKAQYSTGAEVVTQTAEPCGIMNGYIILYRH